MKMDLHTLVKRGLSWDDVIPDDLRSVWISHFEMMQEISNLRFQRVIVPEDVVNLDTNTTDAADASNKMACVPIYARFPHAFQYMPDFQEGMAHTLVNWCFPDQKLFLMDLVSQEQNYWL